MRAVSMTSAFQPPIWSEAEISDYSLGTNVKYLDEPQGSCALSEQSRQG